MPPKSQSFTLASAKGLLNVLQTTCGISQAFDPNNINNPNLLLVGFNAIWDTGATGSVINQRVVDACKLQATGMKQVHGVNSTSMCEVYLVNIILPNNVGFVNVHVTKGELPGSTGIDVLIGMDIITGGDFSITNKNNKTVFSFRCPSMIHTDFVKDHNDQLAKEQFKHGNSKNKHKKRHKTFGKNKY